MDTVFVVVSPGWGNQHRAHTLSLQTLWVEDARKLQKLFWSALQARMLPVWCPERGQDPQSLKAVFQGSLSSLQGPHMQTLSRVGPQRCPLPHPPPLKRYPGVPSRLAQSLHVPGGCCPVYCVWGLLFHMLWTHKPQ